VRRLPRQEIGGDVIGGSRIVRLGCDQLAIIRVSLALYLPTIRTNAERRIVDRLIRRIDENIALLEQMNAEPGPAKEKE
jgi:hypothetical protein